jgi:hypothetical protein
MFASGDQARLVKILGLDREQLVPTSTLKRLVDEVERFDGQHGTDVVGDIQGLMTELDAPDCGLLAQSVSARGLVSFSSAGEYSQTFAESDSGVIARQVADRKGALRRMLDPENLLGYGVARVVRS